MTPRLRVLTWHVRGNYLYSLTQLPDRLVEVVQRLLEDRRLTQGWGREARRTVLERFGIGRFVADW